MQAVKKVFSIDLKIQTCESDRLGQQLSELMASQQKLPSGSEQLKLVSSEEKDTINECSFVNGQLEQEEIDEGAKMSILERVSNIIHLCCQVEGFYNTQTDALISSCAVQAIQSSDRDATIFFIELLQDIIDLKMPQKCKSVVTFNYHFDELMQNLVLIFVGLVKLTGCTSQSEVNPLLTQQEAQHYLVKFYQYADTVLVCPHAGEVNQLSGGQQPDVIDQQIDNNLKGSENSASVNNGMKQELIKSIVSRNICINSQKVLVQLFEQILKSAEQLQFVLKILQQESISGDYFMHAATAIKDAIVASNASSKANQPALIQIERVLIQKLSQINKENDYSLPFVEKSIPMLLDIATNTNNLIAMLQGNQCTKSQEQVLSAIPLIDSKRAYIIAIIMHLLVRAQLQDEHYTIFEYLQKLFLRDENLSLFKHDSNGLIFIFEVIRSQNITLVQNNLYTQVLSLFELIISKASADDIELCFDYIFNYDNQKRCAKQQKDTQFIVDMMSLLSIHLLLNPQLQPVMLEKLINSEYILQIFGFLEVGDNRISDMVLKIAICIIMTYQRLKKKDSFGKKQHFYTLINQLVSMSPTVITEQLCQLTYDLIFWKSENLSLQYPIDPQAVCTLLNRSQLASQLMKQEKMWKDIKNENLVLQITNVDMLELFFRFLKNYKDNEQFNFEILKILETQLDDNNINLILDQNILLWLYNFVKPLPDNEQSFNITTNKVFDIIQKMVTVDICKKSSKICEHFKKFHEDSFFILLILKRFFLQLIDNAVLQVDQAPYVLRNFTGLIQSVDEIIGPNQQTNVLILQCINKMASKNTGSIRLMMKSNNLFEIRDNLLISTLRQEIQPQILLKTLEGVSFEALSQHNKFRESQAISNLLKILIENKDDISLQILTLKILKYDISVNEENQKQVAKLLEN